MFPREERDVLKKSSYRWFVEFREIDYSIAWRSLYRFGYQSCWLQFLIFLWSWENHFISPCCNSISLMVVCNGINRITPCEGQIKTAPDERQAKTLKFLSLLHRRKLNSWFPHTSSTQSCCCDCGELCRRDLDERWRALVSLAGQKRGRNQRVTPLGQEKMWFSPPRELYV